MPTTVAFRGSNPVWLFDDLVGNILDDTYWFFVLQNDIPYLPATVYHDPSATIPWNNPIQFLANGTLPIDIFFDPTAVYRLEIRHGNTQTDPLIYLIENYEFGESGAGPVSASISTQNQITNPQFSLINFTSPLTATSVSVSSVDIAPGWTLYLTGTGSYTITRNALNSAATNPTNAPYSIRLQLSGWTTAILSQRFEQNGVLWAGLNVSGSVTARDQSGGSQITGQLLDSDANVLGVIIPLTNLTGTMIEYKGAHTLAASANTNIPPAAYIDFQLILEGTSDVEVTSFQVVANNIPNLQSSYEQTTVNRQMDQTFNYYANSLIMQPKDTILAGWDFGLNPWQFTTTAQTNVTGNQYTADQTIVIQQAYVTDPLNTNNISVGRASFVDNYGLFVAAVTATNQFALVQYIDPTTVRPYWGRALSSLVKLQATFASAGVAVKMRLIAKAGLPSTISQTEPIASWGIGDNPVFSSGWVAIVPQNDPVFVLSNGNNTISFNNMLLPASSDANMTLGVVIYTVGNLSI